MAEYMKKTDDNMSASTYSENNSFRQQERVTSRNFERTPSLPPPPKPTSSFPYLQSLNRLSTFKDMLIFNAEHLIKENVPRLPARAFEHHHHPSSSRNSVIKDDESDNNRVADQVDFIMPTRKQMIEGIEQDNFLGKYISFSGWIMFLLMRMISLSVFSVFYLHACAYLCVGHYVVMLLCIFYETKFHEKLERNYFHVFLAYIYLFCILEFKIKFIHLKTWYIGYFLFVFLQNLTITLIWYNFMVFQSWWFYFMFNIIIGSGMLSLSCLTFYYFYLRPKDKVLFAND
jgi:membrane-associated HD superfamily phosphohydrolase